jgi:hypothetical protein
MSAALQPPVPKREGNRHPGDRNRREDVHATRRARYRSAGATYLRATTTASRARGCSDRRPDRTKPVIPA